MGTKLPNRWLNYSSIGSKIEGTCFVPFKVPLRQEFFRNRPSDIVFTPSTVKEVVADLRTVVDLTNTNRYYDPKEFTDQNICHEKIYCMGHEIPNESVVKRFFSIVDAHLNSNTKKGTSYLIGVHCTHGLNRTGYLICRYMVVKLGFSPCNAVKAFEQARGYPIERKNYVNDLYRYASGSDKTSPQLSETPFIIGDGQRSGPSRRPPLNWEVEETPSNNRWIGNNWSRMESQQQWRGRGRQTTNQWVGYRRPPQGYNGRGRQQAGQWVGNSWSRRGPPPQANRQARPYQNSEQGHSNWQQQPTSKIQPNRSEERRGRRKYTPY